jgi:hypothetical protein
VITGDLTTKSHPAQASRSQTAFLRLCHAFRLAVNKLNAASRTTSIPTTGMQLIDGRILG